MDARSMFAVLAVVFLLWLVRTWVKWDSQERTALASRQRLRSRLVDSSLAEKVKSTNRSPSRMIEDSVDIDDAIDDIASATADSDSQDVDYGGDTSLDDKRFSGVESTIERLRQQLKLAEEKTLAAQQNDLELRRLRSELQSVTAERTDALNRIKTLEQRLKDQQSALVNAGQDKALITNMDKLRQDLAEREKQNEQLRQQLLAMSADVETAAVQAEIDLSGQEDDSQTDGKETAARSGASASAAKPPLKPLFDAPDEKDDLKLIKGIGPVMERTLNELGVTTFKQLASFTQQDIDKVSEAIGAFPGRIERDDWVGKAQEFLRHQSPA